MSARKSRGKPAPRRRPAAPPAQEAREAREAEAGRPTQRALQKEATRAAILQSALQIFSERGFDGGSTRDIAEHAGVHHALIKYYFDNKDTLWRAAVTFLFDRQAQEMGFGLPPGAMKSRQSRREFAREVLRHYVTYCSRHPEHARLMMQESLRDSERLAWATENFISGTARRGERFVRMLQKEGMLPAGSVPAMHYIIVGGAQLFYTLAPEVRRVWGIDPEDPKVTADHIEALLAVLLR